MSSKSTRLAFSLPSPHSVRWIAFDAVGTLIFPEPPVSAVYGEVARRHGSQLDDEEIAKRFVRLYQENDQKEVDTERNTWKRPDRLQTSEEIEKQRWKEIVTTVLGDVRDPDNCFRELFAYFARPSAWKCFDEVPEVLSRLERRGYRLAVASNFDQRLNKICDGKGELRPIRLRAISSLVGYRKPSLHFFRALQRLAQTPPLEILVVGDDYTNDILGGREAGMQTLFLDRGQSTERGRINTLTEFLDLLPHSANE